IACSLPDRAIDQIYIPSLHDALPIFLELCPVLDLDAQMLHTGLAFPLTDREIHSRILQHPLRIVRLSHGGRRREELRVEAGLCRSEEHTSELQSRRDLVWRLLLEKKK